MACRPAWWRATRKRAGCLWECAGSRVERHLGHERLAEDGHGLPPRHAQPAGPGRRQVSAGHSTAARPLRRLPWPMAHTPAPRYALRAAQHAPQKRQRTLPSPCDTLPAHVPRTPQALECRHLPCQAHWGPSPGPRYAGYCASRAASGNNKAARCMKPAPSSGAHTGCMHTSLRRCIHLQRMLHAGARAAAVRSRRLRAASSSHATFRGPIYITQQLTQVERGRALGRRREAGKVEQEDAGAAPAERGPQRGRHERRPRQRAGQPPRRQHRRAQSRAAQRAVARARIGEQRRHAAAGAAGRLRATRRRRGSAVCTCGCSRQRSAFARAGQQLCQAADSAASSFA